MIKYSIIDLKKLINTHSQYFFYNIYILVFFVFFILIILKFGLPIAVPGANIFPFEFSEWVKLAWPPISFSILSGLLLLITSPLIIFYRKSSAYINSLIPFLLLLLFIFSLLGIVNSDCLDFAILECLYIAGLTCFAVSVYAINSYTKGDLKGIIINSIIITTFLLSAYGVYQYFIGFEQTKEYITSHPGKFPMSGSIEKKLNSNLVFSTFAISNSFAAHLILTLPIICWYMFINWKNNKSLFKFFSYILLGLFLVFTLYITRSRGAYLSLIISSSTAFLLINPFNKKIKTFLILTLILLIGLILIYSTQKGLDSIFIRFDYFSSSIKIFLNNILFGGGWGNFFFYYPQLSSFPTTESPHMPHNFILSMGSQSGILALIIAVFIFFMPIFLLARYLNNKKFLSVYDFNFPIFIGWTAWAIHSLIDINFQIPSTTATAIALLSISKINYRLKMKKIIYIIFITIIISLSIITTHSSFIRTKGEYHIKKLERICYTSLRNDSENSKMVTKQLKKCNNMLPYSPFPWILAANYFIKIDNKEITEICLKNAIICSPKHASYYYKLALIQYQKKDFQSTLRNLRKAYKLFPGKYKNKYQQFLKKLKKKK